MITWKKPAEGGSVRERGGERECVGWMGVGGSPVADESGEWDKQD